jgi:hypothetical protein
MELPSFVDTGPDEPKPGFPLSPRALDLGFGDARTMTEALSASGTTDMEGVMGQAVRPDMASMEVPQW